MNRNRVAFWIVAVGLAACVAVPYALAQPAAENPGDWPMLAQQNDRPPNPPMGPGGGGMPGGGMPGGGMPGGGPMHMARPNPALTSPEIAQMEGMIQLIQRMRIVSFGPEDAGLMAIGAIKSEVQRTPDEVAKDMEDLLAKTKTLGLRNSIRMVLKDIYKAQGKNEKLLTLMREMLAENDAAIQAEPKGEKK